MRFVFFGGEEEWLIGSDDYVKSLDVEALKDVALYLNFDMVGSPNPGYFTLDGNLSGPTDPEFAQLPEGSAGIEEAFSEFLGDAGIPTQDLTVDGRGDYNAFVRAGIPAGQLFTGSEAAMTRSRRNSGVGGPTSRSTRTTTPPTTRCKTSTAASSTSRCPRLET